MTDSIFTVCPVCDYEFDVDKTSGECPNCGLEYVVRDGEVKWRYTPPDDFKMPEIGDEIYVPSSFHISAGHLDKQGGLATITEIKGEYDPKNCNCLFVKVKEVSGEYNYLSLLKQQDELKKRFGKRRAYPDPDEDTPWIEEGDSVDGKLYHGEPIW